DIHRDGSMDYFHPNENVWITLNTPSPFDRLWMNGSRAKQCFSPSPRIKYGAGSDLSLQVRGMS
ncbi:MAG: hypothetical protein JSU58_08335, partial [Dehalococcoidales bacterium]